MGKALAFTPIAHFKALKTQSRSRMEEARAKCQLPNPLSFPNSSRLKRGA